MEKLINKSLQPRKGKARVKVTASGKKISYGQAGRGKRWRSKGKAWNV